MKRILLIGFSTLAALVVVFLYPTSTGHSGTTAAEAVSAARIVSGAPATTVAPTTTGQGPDPTPADPNSSAAATPSPGTAATDPGTTSTATSPGSSDAAPGATTPQATASVTVDGAAAMTRYGVVQVQVVITDGKITEVTPLQYPQQDRRDIQINNAALPKLRAQVISAQSANIDGVSGATFTTDGYVTSLQSALDAAGFQP